MSSVSPSCLWVSPCHCYTALLLGFYSADASPCGPVSSSSPLFPFLSSFFFSPLFLRLLLLHSTPLVTWPEILIANNSLAIIWYQVSSFFSTLPLTIYHLPFTTCHLPFAICHFDCLAPCHWFIGLQSHASINAWPNWTCSSADLLLDLLSFAPFSSTEPKMSFSVRLNVVGKWVKTNWSEETWIQRECKKSVQFLHKCV